MPIAETDNGICVTLRDVTMNLSSTDASVLQDFSHRFEADRIYVLMGRNGCGKSTLLRLLAGELVPTHGRVVYQTRRENESTVEYMPQDYRVALFPWRSVETNIYPWRRRGSVKIAEAEINKVLDVFGLRGLRHRRVFALSGGQQQLVLLARCALATEPIILADEPLSALDVVRRVAVAETLRAAWQKPAGRLVVAAMHEPDEAADIADTVLIFDGPPLTLRARIDRDAVPNGMSFRDMIFNTIATGAPRKEM